MFLMRQGVYDSFFCPQLSTASLLTHGPGQ